MMKLLQEKFGKDFFLGIESSANQLSVFTGIKNYINVYSDLVFEEETPVVDGRTVHAKPKPNMEVTFAEPHILSQESIFILSITGESWDTLTRIIAQWGQGEDSRNVG